MSFSAASSAGGTVMKGVQRTTPQLYRDCFRLIQHIAGKSKKGQNIRMVVRSEFRKNSHVKDPAVVDNLKSHAIRGLANYLMIESTAKDSKLQKSAQNFAKQQLDDIKNLK